MTVWLTPAGLAAVNRLAAGCYGKVRSDEAWAKAAAAARSG